MADDTMPDGSPFPVWDDETDYTKTYHVAQQQAGASDENEGTEEKPFATIGRAAAVLQPGEKVLIHEGTYRECVRPARGGEGADRMIAYEAAAGETVIVRGSEEWAPTFLPSEGWRTESDGSYHVWMADLPAQWFVGYNPFMATNLSDEYTTFGIPFSPDETVSMQMRRGLVFLDGKSLKQVQFPGHLARADGTYWVEYDHVVDVLVSDGDFVEAGQPLARAAPASIRHGGPEGEKPVDEFEWGLRRGGQTAFGVCPMGFLKEEEQTKLQSVLETMRSLGFPSGDSLCLAEEVY